MLLLTTPDYLPKLGGLSSHTLNVEKVLKELGIEYQLFHWKSYKDIITIPKTQLESYDTILNIHSGFHMHMPECNAKIVNFVNGAEILFYSPNFLKHMIKRILRKKSIKRIETAHKNIFISDFTFQMLISKGLRPDYSRDLIFHMCVETSGQKNTIKNWTDGILTFICVARDVPHKNFTGVIRLCEKIQAYSGRKVELITVTNKEFSSDIIKIHSYINPDNKLRDELLAKAHINLLLSLDHSKKGFFEGFGQIVQEAGCFTTPSLVLGTGGLPESVHHKETGWVLPDLSDNSVEAWWNEMSPEAYRQVADRCYVHTLESHGLDSWKRLFKVLLQK